MLDFATGYYVVLGVQWKYSKICRLQPHSKEVNTENL